MRTISVKECQSILQHLILQDIIKMAADNFELHPFLESLNRMEQEEEIDRLYALESMSKYEYELCGSYELQVNKSRIKCSKKVIESSKLWLDMVDLTDPKDDSPITIPSFISEQMILDLVEMVEKGDMKCHHLGKLVILSFECCIFSWKCFQFLLHSRTNSNS